MAPVNGIVAASTLSAPPNPSQTCAINIAVGRGPEIRSVNNHVTTGRVDDGGTTVRTEIRLTQNVDRDIAAGRILEDIQIANEVRGLGDIHIAADIETAHHFDRKHQLTSTDVGRERPVTEVNGSIYSQIPTTVTGVVQPTGARSVAEAASLICS